MNAIMVVLNCLVVATVAIAISGCSPIETKAPVTKVFTEHKLHAGMGLMAQQVAKLSNMSLDNSRNEQNKSEDVLVALDQIETIASDFGGDGVVTNYSVISRYMGAFLYDVQIAREFALREPPNNFPAYTLVKSCLSCHQSL